jgi:ADP-ribose/FAD diphosphatase
MPEGDSRERVTCDHCGTVEYDNPKVVVACQLFEGDRLLWLRRSADPYAGRWTVPSGFVECGETIREAASRELREETRLVVDPADWRLHSVLSLPDINQIYISLAAPLPNRDFQPTAEASEIAMFRVDEVRSLDLGYPAETRVLVEGMYDSVARGTAGVASGRLWDITGQDPTAIRAEPATG